MKQKRVETAVILSNTHGFSATQRFCCCCTTRQKFTPWEKQWWHHLNWLAFCLVETKASSHPGGVRPLGWEELLCVCFNWVVCTCVYICGNLARPLFTLYGLLHNVANIVVKVELYKETMQRGTTRLLIPFDVVDVSVKKELPLCWVSWCWDCSCLLLQQPHPLQSRHTFSM